MSCYKKRKDIIILTLNSLSNFRRTLTGAKFTIFPKVEAAKPPPVPEKPPPMKPSDLPLYKTPHVDYKEHEYQKILCPDINKKLLQSFLLPYVSSCRKTAQNIGGMVVKEARDTKNEASDFIEGNKKEIKKYMRDPKNLSIRQGFVAAGGLTGLILAWKRGIPAKFFLIGLGLTSTGSLCFPKETDQYFREFCYYTGKAFVCFYNCTCKKDYSMRERLPCKGDLPVIPKRSGKPQCPEKK